MRKGRSSRRNRNSRPLIGAKPPPSTADALSSDIRPSASPRVVISVPSSEPAIEAKASIAADGPSSKSKGSGETLAGIGANDDREAERPTAPPPSESEGRASRPKDFTSTAAFGSSATRFEVKDLETSDKDTRDEAEAAPKSETKGDVENEKSASKDEAETEKSDAKSERTKDDASKTERERADAKEKDAAGEEAEAGGVDETSVPPVGDLEHEEFFSEADVSRHLAAESVDATEALTVPDKMKRKAEPAVVERRARFARYVKWAVAGATIVCLVAVARTSMTSKAPSPPAPVPAAQPASVPEQAAPKAAEPAASPAATAAPTTENTASEATTAASATETAATETAATESSATESSATESSATESSATETAATSAESSAAPVTGDAKEEKQKARRLLERRKVAEAIEAGERAVALDPTDGEAWLILGAAYQEKGNIAAARRAYAACLKEGKTGPRHECAKMLR